LSRATKKYSKNRLKREKAKAMEVLKANLNGISKGVSTMSKEKRDKLTKSVHKEIKRIGNLAKFEEKKIAQSRRRRHRETIKIKVGFEYKKDR